LATRGGTQEVEHKRWKIPPLEFTAGIGFQSQECGANSLRSPDLLHTLPGRIKRSCGHKGLKSGRLNFDGNKKGHWKQTVLERSVANTSKLVLGKKENSYEKNGQLKKKKKKA